jgi:hypothetical protein
MPRPETVDLETLTDLCTPWCLRVVATLGIGVEVAATGRDPSGRFVVECRPT